MAEFLTDLLRIQFAKLWKYSLPTFLGGWFPNLYTWLDSGCDTNFNTEVGLTLTEQKPREFHSAHTHIQFDQLLNCRKQLEHVLLHLGNFRLTPKVIRTPSAENKLELTQHKSILSCKCVPPQGSHWPNKFRFCLGFWKHFLSPCLLICNDHE